MSPTRVDIGCYGDFLSKGAVYGDGPLASQKGAHSQNQHVQIAWFSMRQSARVAPLVASILLNWAAERDLESIRLPNFLLGGKTSSP